MVPTIKSITLKIFIIDFSFLRLRNLANPNRFCKHIRQMFQYNQTIFANAHTNDCPNEVECNSAICHDKSSNTYFVVYRALSNVIFFK